MNLNNVADRFITSRSDTNFELGEHLFANGDVSLAHHRALNASRMGSKSAPQSPDKEADEEYENMMRQRLNAGEC